MPLPRSSLRGHIGLRTFAAASVLAVLALAVSRSPAAATPPASAGAGASVAASVVASDAGARMERLADGVYAIVHSDATRSWPEGTTAWPHGNTGVVVGDDGVLVVDATYFPSRARADIALIRRVTDKPVRWLVNTHWHGDHTHGNGVYREAFPGLVIVGQRENRGFIEVNLEKYPRGVVADSSFQRQTLAQLEARRASGRDSAGRALSAAQRALLDTIVEEQRAEIAELAAVKVTPPDLLFDEQIELRLGSRRVEIRDQGRANSPHDVTVWLPEERVLFAGDIVVHPVPYAWQSHPLPWIDVLRRIEAMPAAALVPGHGPVMRDLAYVRQVRELLEATRDQVVAQFRTGKTIAQAAASLDLGAFRPRFVRAGSTDMAETWQGSIVGALAERMAACVQGYRC